MRATEARLSAVRPSGLMVSTRPSYDSYVSCTVRSPLLLLLTYVLFVAVLLFEMSGAKAFRARFAGFRRRFETARDFCAFKYSSENIWC